MVHLHLPLSVIFDYVRVAVLLSLPVPLVVSVPFSLTLYDLLTLQATTYYHRHTDTFISKSGRIYSLSQLCLKPLISRISFLFFMTFSEIFGIIIHIVLYRKIKDLFTYFFFSDYIHVLVCPLVNLAQYILSSYCQFNSLKCSAQNSPQI